MNDTISRQAAIDALRKMQTYKMFSGDDMLLIDQAGAQTELMLLPPAELGTNLAEVGTNCISRQAAIDALNSRKTAEQCEAGKTRNWTVDICVDMIKQLPPIQPTDNSQKLADEIASFKRHVKSDNSDYLTGYLCALSVVEGMIADMREVNHESN